MKGISKIASALIGISTVACAPTLQQNKSTAEAAVNNGQQETAGKIKGAVEGTDLNLDEIGIESVLSNMESLFDEFSDNVDLLSQGMAYDTTTRSMISQRGLQPYEISNGIISLNGDFMARISSSEDHMRMLIEGTTYGRGMNKLSESQIFRLSELAQEAAPLQDRLENLAKDYNPNIQLQRWILSIL